MLIENLLSNDTSPTATSKFKQIVNTSNQFDCLFKFMEKKNIPYKWCIAGGFMAYVDKRTSTFTDIDIWIDIGSMEYLPSITIYLNIVLGAVTQYPQSTEATYNKVDKVITICTIGLCQLLFTCYAEKMDLENYMDTIISDFDLQICAVGFNPNTKTIVRYNITGKGDSVKPERLLKYQNRVLPDYSIDQLQMN